MSWHFKDTVNKIQGPFGDGEMRAWFEAGYLASDLMICKGDPRSSPFRKLTEWFPNAQLAFLVSGPPPGAGPTGGAEWYFVDRNGAVQGPFTDSAMHQWFMAGYFEPTIQIMNAAGGNAQWATLQQTFPNMVDAFMAPAAGSMTSGSGSGSRSQHTAANRFEFPEWLPAPPRYRSFKKTYPSEKNSGKRRENVQIVDVNGQAVKNFAHAR